MKKMIRLLLATALLAVMFVASVVASEVAPKKIGMTKATKIALKRVPGTIKSKELEKEHGKWIYSFDISTGKGKITEVNVDAYTGKVLAVEHEDAAKEKKEAQDEKKQKN